MANRLAFISAVLGTLAVFLLTVLGGAAFPNYSHASQFISELGARGAPNAQVINFAGFLPAGVLICTFALCAWRTLPRSRVTSLGFLGIALFAAGYLVAAFFPCEGDCRPAQPSASQAVHNLLGLAGYVTAPLALALLGWQARSWPKASHLFFAGFGCAGVALLGLLFLSPDFEYVGIAQRLLEASVLSWVVLCAWYINRQRHEKAW